MSRARNRRWPALLGSSLLLTSAFALSAASPAAAADVTATVDGIFYSADDSNVPAGAVVVSYHGPGGAVTIPDTVEINGDTYDVVRVGNSAFDDVGLTSVNVGANVTSIGLWAFADNQITSVSLPAGLQEIDSWAFESNLLTSVDLPAGVHLEYRAFADNALTSLTLPDGFDFPAAGGPTAQFAENQIASLTLPDSVTHLPHYVFEANSLGSVVIPASVQTISEDAFDQNPLLTSIDFLGDAPEILGAGWSDNAGLTYLCQFDEANGGGFTSPTWNDGYDDLNASAHPVTVTFQNDHGPDVTQQVDCNGLVSEPTDPVADGYDFVGWTLNGDTFNFATLPARSDMTIVAQWEPAADDDSGDDSDAGADSSASGDDHAGAKADDVLPATGLSGAADRVGVYGGLLVVLGTVVALLGSARRARR